VNEQGRIEIMSWSYDSAVARQERDDMGRVALMENPGYSLDAPKPIGKGRTPL